MVEPLTFMRRVCLRPGCSATGFDPAEKNPTFLFVSRFFSVEKMKYTNISFISRYLEHPLDNHYSVSFVIREELRNLFDVQVNF